MRNTSTARISFFCWSNDSSALKSARSEYLGDDSKTDSVLLGIRLTACNPVPQYGSNMLDARGSLRRARQGDC